MASGVLIALVVGGAVLLVVWYLVGAACLFKFETECAALERG
jgi:hypothetical protein